MKILLYTDNHYCTYSSIIRKRGPKHSYRIDNSLVSLKWAEDLAFCKKCDEVICLGDFFDSSSLSAEEISALLEINWYNVPHTFLIGNHEMGAKDLTSASSYLFGLVPNHTVISSPSSLSLPECNILALPYIVEEDRLTLREYKEELDINSDKPLIVLSHNDIAGIQYGGFISKQGFGLGDITANCNLFLNGHIHNRGEVAPNVYNLGNLTGQNFNEDATKYSHGAYILDTQTLQLDYYENPHALNFYKLEVFNKAELDELNIKSNSVVTLKCPEDLKEDAHAWLQNPCIVESRLIISYNNNENTSIKVDELQIDHLSKFREFFIDQLGLSSTLEQELEEILK